MGDPRFIPRHNLKQKIIVIRMNVFEDLLGKVDDVVKANRLITIDGEAEEGHDCPMELDMIELKRCKALNFPRELFEAYQAI
ncbi:hypothetical protein TNCV_4517041 [Trichonephila clavipes]|nr:hypothetical protein TNCV_4517041 [Trichonephila clavipes]